VQSTLEKVFADKHVSIQTLGEVEQGPPSPLNPQLMRSIAKITDSLWPGVPVIPSCLSVPQTAFICVEPESQLMECRDYSQTGMTIAYTPEMSA